MVPPLDAWPLSAATTAVLREPGTPPAQVLRLGVRELVVRGALAVEVVPGLRPGSRSRLQVGLGAGAPGPVPLPALHAALVRETDRAALLPAVVAAALRTDRALPVRLRDACRAELRQRDLLVGERTRLLGLLPRVRWSRTPAGDAWVGAAERAVRDDGDVAPAVLLALGAAPTRRRRRGARAARDERTPDLDELLDRALDGDLRSGSGDGWSDGGGGDGGGGGD